MVMNDIDVAKLFHRGDQWLVYDPGPWWKRLVYWATRGWLFGPNWKRP